MKILEMLKKKKVEAKKYRKSEKEYNGAPSFFAKSIMNDSLTGDDIRSSELSDEQLKEYCKKLLDAGLISEERYHSIVDSLP
jgi:hypothetical protein